MKARVLLFASLLTCTVAAQNRGPLDLAGISVARQQGLDAAYRLPDR